MNVQVNSTSACHAQHLYYEVIYDNLQNFLGICPAVLPFWQVAGRLEYTMRVKVCNTKILVCIKKAVYFFTHIQSVRNMLLPQCHVYWPLLWPSHANLQLQLFPIPQKSCSFTSAAIPFLFTFVFLKDMLSIHLGTPGTQGAPLNLRHTGISWNAHVVLPKPFLFTRRVENKTWTPMFFTIAPRAF